MRRRTFIKNFALAASLPWIGRTAFAADDKAPKAISNSHKVLSCNIRVDVPADTNTGDGWAQRKELCAEVIHAQKADLIGIQECQEAHFKDLRSRMPEYEAYALANPDPVFHPANAILFSRARYELISAGGFWLSETPHVAGSKSWDSARSRFANWVDLKEKASGKEFRFWNTHLDHIGQQAREKGAAMIVQASAPLSKDLPQIWTMDANASTDNNAIRTVRDGGWQDTYTAVHGSEDPGTTFHGFKGPKRGNGKKIDWIFCKGPVKAVSASIIRDGRNDHYPSDHYFVSAEVSF
jgi:endonuclease/exonuclease/phosphatase family metal-dependent hydrolase